MAQQYTGNRTACAFSQHHPDHLRNRHGPCDSKPHPKVFLKAAEMIGLESADCLVVEDAHAGAERAVAGGFDCAAIGDAKNDSRAVVHPERFSDLCKHLL